ncbi:unnamed protein product [Microthlaspi erraticum]|uniref:Uncharacterized protein n=1 Tax=Microthlaspi erraticum TaxID=1685480 RepID=A0A6D2IKH4_9BRAS|nr:unnamed protein product [Microthlaspi erraticum]
MNTKQKEAVSTDAQAKRRSSKMPKEARSYCPQHLGHHMKRGQLWEQHPRGDLASGGSDYISSLTTGDREEPPQRGDLRNFTEATTVLKQDRSEKNYPSAHPRTTTNQPPRLAAPPK